MPYLKEFYFGDKKHAAEINSIFIGKDLNGVDMVVKPGRFGPYVQLGEVTDDSKPKTQSLFKNMKPEHVERVARWPLIEFTSASLWR